MTTPNTAATVPQPAGQKSATPRKPNYGRIHAKPLPLSIYALPPLIPHNPFSLLHIALAYGYQVLTGRTSHPAIVYQAYWSPETSSVHVTDEAAIRALWECGFFGKGSLSRSEPSWLDREKKRRGLIANETSEEFTAQRREERKKFKKERARKEREAIEEKLEEERRSRANSTPEPTSRAEYEGMNGSTDSLADSIQQLIQQQPETPITPTPFTFPAAISRERRQDLGDPETVNGVVPDKTNVHGPATEIANQEHLQLTPSEAFFLTYGLGILEIRNPASSAIIPTSDLFTLFRAHSYFPPSLISSLQPDDPFLLSYINYHHFRSLGWVVRPGIKFAVDWLLYLRGPVFSHAEFAVIILPAFTDAYWRSAPEIEKATRKKEAKNWWWLHCVNRVQSQVKKSLVLAYVEVPPPGKLPAADGEGKVDIGAFLGQYKVREMILKRWIPNRERD